MLTTLQPSDPILWHLPRRNIYTHTSGKIVQFFFNAKERGHWLQSRQAQLQGTDGILHSSESQLAIATHSMATQSQGSELKKIKTETENSFVQDFKV